MFDWIFAKFSARRMKLRDRGKVRKRFTEENGEYIIQTRTCPFCKTRIRIGIQQDGVLVEYCWRCEKFKVLMNSPEENNKPPERGKILKLIK